jgi:RNA polymerase sigma-70 factor (ECF subfamily)
MQAGTTVRVNVSEKILGSNPPGVVFCADEVEEGEGRMDHECLRLLLDRHADALELYARSWCDTPEDVVQEAFVALARLRQTPDNPASWLFRAVRNGAINAGIAGKRRRRREARKAADARPWFEPDSEAPDLDPDALQVVLAGLPTDQRETIVAHLWGGLTFEQIAEIAGTSASSAHRNYHAGLQTLRARLGVPCPTDTTNRRTTN